MSKPGLAREAGCMLASGMEPALIAQSLGISWDRLLSLMDCPQTQTVYRQSVRMMEMQNYGLALNWLGKQMQSDNGAMAVKAAHEIIGRLPPVEGEGEKILLEEAE